MKTVGKTSAISKMTSKRVNNKDIESLLSSARVTIFSADSFPNDVIIFFFKFRFSSDEDLELIMEVATLLLQKIEKYVNAFVKRMFDNQSEPPDM